MKYMSGLGLLFVVLFPLSTLDAQTTLDSSYRPRDGGTLSVDKDTSSGALLA
jgi:hypothetical protein